MILIYSSKYVFKSSKLRIANEAVLSLSNLLFKLFNSEY